MKADIRLNGTKHTLLELDEPRTISALITETAIDKSRILSYKIDHTQHVNEDYLIDRETLINCICFEHPEGMRIYQDSAIYILAKAFYNVFGSQHTMVIEHSIGDGVYGEVFNTERFTEQDCARIKQEMLTIVENDIPIEPIDVKPSEAYNIFSTMGRRDIIKNITQTYQERVRVYRCGKYYDCFIRPLADRTGKIKVFDLIFHAPGFLLRFPSGKACNICLPFSFPRKLFRLHQEHDKWLSILNVHYINDLNVLTQDYDISQFILVEEALHEKKIAEIASEIVKNKDLKIILIAGPSSSGKTTFAKRISVQLQACKAKPIVLGMDDYFLPRDQTPRKENGEYDFESIHALDLPYLNQQLTMLLRGDQVEIPRYDFRKGVRKRTNHVVKLALDNIIIIEGIHGLNEQLTASIPAANKVKIYISALNQLNIDNHNRIPTTDCRLIRRIVRDYQYRGYTAEETITRWRDVRDGEEVNIFPYQENADFMFNSSLTYELGVLKKHAWKLLLSVSKTSTAYMESRRLLSLLSHIYDIPDALVPYNSIIREFTNGSIFRY